MRGIWTIMHKELVRVFRSPSMLLALLSPGLLIFAMYSFIGATAPETSEQRALNETFIVYTANMPTSMLLMLESPAFNVFTIDHRQVTIQEAQNQVDRLETEEVHMVMIFDDNFEQSVIDNINNPTRPRVYIHHNPHYIVSSIAHNFVFMPLLYEFRNIVIYNETNVNPNLTFEPYRDDIFDERRVVGGVLADMIPMMLLIFLFTGCMTITAESIAGEKERGTISTLLATPTHRRSIAIGKIASLSIIALLSALSSFFGMMFGLPNLMNMELSGLYTFGEWALVFLIISATVLFIVGAMAVISAFAKNIKEATLWISVLMFVGMGVSMLTMVFGVPTNILLYLIPLYGTTLSLAAIISFEVVMINLIAAFAANVVYAAIIVWVLAKMFNNERIMFSK